MSISDIKVFHGDTLVVPIGSGTWGDRGAVTGSGAVILAARKIREKLLRVAALLTEVPQEDLELAQGMVRRKSDKVNLLSVAEIARRLINAPGRTGRLPVLSRDSRQRASMIRLFLRLIPMEPMLSPSRSISRLVRSSFLGR